MYVLSSDDVSWVIVLKYMIWPLATLISHSWQFDFTLTLFLIWVELLGNYYIIIGWSKEEILKYMICN